MDLTKMMLAGWDERLHSLLESELDRRKNAVYEAMDAAGTEVLMIVNMAKQGFYQWFFAAGISERPTEEILIVPRYGQMLISLSSQCFTDVEQENYRKPESVSSQDKRYGSAVNVPALHHGYIGRNLGDSKRLGIINPEFIRKTVKEYLDNCLPGLEWVDMTTEIEAIKAVKSPAEQQCLTEAAGLCDRLFGAMGVMLRPFCLEADTVRELRYRAYEMGSGGEDVTRNIYVDLASAPDGGHAIAKPVLYPGRQLIPGDRINLMVRAIAFDEYYGALGRCYILGKASGETKENWQIVLEAQRAAVAMLKPGNTIGAAIRAMNDVFISRQMPEDGSVNICGLGYRPDELPRRYDASENMILQSGMVLCVSPKLSLPGKDPWQVADMYCITENGAVQLTKTDAGLVELFVE